MPNKDDIRLGILRRALAASKMQSATSSVDEIKQARAQYQGWEANNDDLRFEPSAPIYVAIERATVLGGGHRVEGLVYIVRSGGQLKPINGKELVDLAARYPNFVKNWRPKDDDNSPDDDSE